MELGDPPPDGSIVTLRRSLLAAGGDRQHPTCQDQHRTDCEEFEVPAQRPAEIVADVVDAEDLVVDDSFDHVEEPESNQDPADQRVAVNGPAPVKRRCAAHACSRHTTPNAPLFSDQRS